MAERMALGLDADAAFESVAHDQLGGEEQIPAELIRLAIGCGAQRVAVELGRRTLTLEAPGAVMPPDLLGHAVTALSTAEARHGRLEALHQLETAGAAVVAWAAGRKPRRMLIRSSDGERRSILRIQKTGPPVLVRERTSEPIGLGVEIHGSSIRVRAAADWVRMACRFAPVPVLLNGVNVQRPLSSGSFRTTVHHPVPASVALGVTLEAPRLWLLKGGVVMTRVTVPGWPPIEAAVEMGGLVAAGDRGGRVREALGPHLRSLLTRGVEQTLTVVPRFATVNPERRVLLIRTLLIAAERRMLAGRIGEAPMFEVCDAGSSRWISLEDLKHWEGPLPEVVEPEGTGRDGEGKSVTMGAWERDLTAGLIGRPLPAAPPPENSGWRGFRKGLRGVLDACVDRTGVPRRRWSPTERALADGLERALRSGGEGVQVSLRSGRGAPRRWGARLLLGRSHQETRAAARALERDDSALYPIAMALKDPEWSVAEEIQHRWWSDRPATAQPPAPSDRRTE